MSRGKNILIQTFPILVFFLFATTGYAELVDALQRLQGELNKQGFASLAGRVTAAQSCLLGPTVARALHIRTAVLQRRRPRTENPICSDAQALARDVSFCKNVSHLFLPSIVFVNAPIIIIMMVFPSSLSNRWRSQVPKMPLNCVICCQHTKWKDCCRHMIVSQLQPIDRWPQRSTPHHSMDPMPHRVSP